MSYDREIWKCGDCGELNDSGVPCRNGHGYYGSRDTRLWKCNYCGTVNAWSQWNCLNCNKKYNGGW